MRRAGYVADVQDRRPVARFPQESGALIVQRSFTIDDKHRCAPAFCIEMCIRDSSGILLNVQNAKDARGAPLLGEQRELVFDRVAGTAVLHLFAVQADDSAFAGSHAENIFQHLGAAGAVQAGEADDLALMYICLLYPSRCV